MSEMLVLGVVRPYASEAELLQQEAWTITKKSVFLIGIPPHPEGTSVRCELAIGSGVKLLVAEGVVAKHMAEHGNRPSGIVVRFRRMSAASSQFVNRALSVRDTMEASSPSTAENFPPSSPTPISEIGAFEPRSLDVTAVKLPDAVASKANENVGGTPRRLGTSAGALMRLASRPASPLLVPDDRESALARLRIRIASGPRT